VRADGHGRLSVANTGRHLPEDQLPQLFEPFHTTGTGAGLGLSIVDSIARAHDGVVTATPRPGGGLRIEVVLPTGS
jgi:signal transduction histidine kinase